MYSRAFPARAIGPAPERTAAAASYVLLTRSVGGVVGPPDPSLAAGVRGLVVGAARGRVIHGVGGRVRGGGGGGVSWALGLGDVGEVVELHGLCEDLAHLVVRVVGGVAREISRVGAPRPSRRRPLLPGSRSRRRDPASRPRPKNAPPGPPEVAPRVLRRGGGVVVEAGVFVVVRVDALDAGGGADDAIVPRAVVVVGVVDVARLADRARTPRELRDAEGEVFAQGDRVDGVVLGVLGRGGEPARDELLGEHRGRVRELLLVEEHGEDVEASPAWCIAGAAAAAAGARKASPRRAAEEARGVGTHQATREGGKCRGRAKRSTLKRLARADFPSSTTDFADRALTGCPLAPRAIIVINQHWLLLAKKLPRARSCPSAKHAARDRAGLGVGAGVFTHARAASLARAASSIRARARVGAPSRRRRRRREEGPVRASRADPLLAARS